MIEVRNLTKRYGGATAVDDLTFTVQPGTVTGFLGPNGAGKSTTMRMIVGLDTPTSGEALIDGVPYSQLKNPISKVGCLLDASWTHNKRSAKSHLRMIAAAAGVSASRADEMLALVGLADVSKRKVGGYSLGMRQRLGLATAMLGDPEVLVFDEPVNGLDPEGILWIRRFMHARAAEGRTVLVSSHLLSEMAQTAQDLVVIGRGRLRAQTSVDEFVSRADGTVLLRTPQSDEFASAAEREGLRVEFDARAATFTIPDVRSAAVGDIAAKYGITVHELTEKRASLEEAFMALTESDVEYHGTDGPSQNRLPGAGTKAGQPQSQAYEPQGQAPLQHGGPPAPGYLPDYRDDQRGGRR